MKIYRSLLVILLVFSFSSCEKLEEKQLYYPDGKVRYLYHLKRGLINGLAVSYYNTGVIRGSAKWNNGKKDGEVKIYYPSGKLKKIANWQSDLLNGLSETFYENGKPETKDSFANGSPVGWSYTYFKSGGLRVKSFIQVESKNSVAIVFDKYGKQKEKHIRRSDGSLIYIAPYDANGKEEAGAAVPYYYKNNHFNSSGTEADTDTISAGETYNTSMRFYLKINRRTRLIVSSSKRFDKRFDKNIDTLSMVESPEGGTFEVKRKPLRVGENLIFYKFICSDCPLDTLSTSGASVNSTSLGGVSMDGVSIIHPFFLRKSGGDL